MKLDFLKRASLAGALFFLLQPVFAAGQCNSPDEPEWHRVKHVHDGDSLLLSDRTKVRLIGVNTPELARDGEPAEPFAEAARAFTMQAIKRAGGRIGLIYDQDRKDRFGRTLAHVFLPDSSNLARQLISHGLGSHIAISPNLLFSDCYASAERSARNNQANLWGSGDLVHDLQHETTISNGFRHIRGRISRVGEGPHNTWLNIGEKLAIRVSRDDLNHFSGWQFDSLVGQVIETSGWVYTRKGKQRLRVYHPSVIKIHAPDD